MTTGAIIAVLLVIGASVVFATITVVLVLIARRILKHFEDGEVRDR
jgi:hypothetical protein